MEKNLSFQQKMDIVLRLRDLTIKDIERELEKDGTFYKAYNEDRSPSKKTIAEFLRKFHIREGWWNNPVGEDEAAVFNENLTRGEKPSDNKENPLGDLGAVDAIKAGLDVNSAYRLMPVMVLEGTVLVPERVLLKWMEAKDELITQLKEDLAYERSRSAPVPAPQGNK